MIYCNAEWRSWPSVSSDSSPSSSLYFFALEAAAAAELSIQQPLQLVTINGDDPSFLSLCYSCVVQRHPPFPKERGCTLVVVNLYKGELELS